MIARYRERVIAEVVEKLVDAIAELHQFLHDGSAA